MAELGFREAFANLVPGAVQPKDRLTDIRFYMNYYFAFPSTFWCKTHSKNPSANSHYESSFGSDFT